MSSELQLGIKDGRSAFRPGEEIAGAARWEYDEAPESAEVRLCWFTRGKGTEDADVVERVPLDAPAAGDVRTFSFVAPESPYSFSGRLISLIWAVEVVLKPGDRFTRQEIVIGPEAREVLLPKITEPRVEGFRIRQ